MTLDEALEIYRQPKQRGRRAAAATPPLRELGADAATGKPMVIKDGRFGPYVTDGETNASLRKGDSVEEITDERAVGAARRAPGQGPGAEEDPGARSRRGEEAPGTQEGAGPEVGAVAHPVAVTPRARRTAPSAGITPRSAGAPARQGVRRRTRV